MTRTPPTDSTADQALVNDPPDDYASATVAGADPDPGRRRARRSPRAWTRDAWSRGPLKDAANCLFFLALGMWTTGGLWPDPQTRALAINKGDQALIEWFLAEGALLWTGDFHFVTHGLNSPDGVNLLSNASHLLQGFILAPLTLAFGAPVAFAVLLTGNLVATSIGWYFLFTRTLRLVRPAAVLGAAFCGFAPGMMSQSNSHLHITAQWLVPPIVWCVIRLARAHRDRGPHWPRRVIGTGVGLGVLVFLQLLLGEEVLLLTAMTLMIFVVIYAVVHPRQVPAIAPRFVLGAAVGGLVALVLLAYPLHVQFEGAQHVPNGPFNPAFFFADLASFTSISPLALLGDPSTGHLSPNQTEYCSYFGLPLLLVALGATVWLALDRSRRGIALGCAGAALVMGGLALGPEVIRGGVHTGHKGPYSLLQGLPVIDGALPVRFALAMIPLIAILLALATDQALTSPTRIALVIPVAVLTALVPVLPGPLPTEYRAPVPRFFSQGYWHTCVRPGGVLVPVPLPTLGNPDAMRWAAAADARFGMPEGLFIGPYAAGGRASIGIYPRPTSRLFNIVEQTGEVPPIGVTEVRQAQQDVTYWKATCLVLAHGPHETQLRATLTRLYGPGELVADMWIWRVKP